MFVGAIDQGTSSTRFLLFNRAGGIVAQHQVEFPQYYPQAGWHEHNPQEILDSVIVCINEAVAEMEKKGLDVSEIKAIGITNQRETTVCWDAITGQALCNAIVWDDMRTQDLVSNYTDRNCLAKSCGLPITTYFSALKLKWMLDNVPSVYNAYKDKRLMFGTIDSWLIYKLSSNKVHITDVTNASRTMFMDINTRQWSPEILKFFEIDDYILPTIRSSAEVYCELALECRLTGVPISGCLGDQQAAFVGQQCFGPGDAKNTYGTGCFMLYNTGTKPVFSTKGLLTTVGYQLGKRAKTVYALEGSVAVAGSAVKWLRDGLGVIQRAEQVGEMASQVPDTAGVYFVTAFSGLYAPYWRDDARGCIVGLTQYATKQHLARATLEAVCFQTKAIVEAMEAESKTKLQRLRVDGGMTNSSICMQLQADLLGIVVQRPDMRETTALGAAMAAGMALDIWEGPEEANVSMFSPSVSEEERAHRYSEWNRAIERSLNWISSKKPTKTPSKPKETSGFPVWVGVVAILAVVLLRRL